MDRITLTKRANGIILKFVYYKIDLTSITPTIIGYTIDLWSLIYLKPNETSTTTQSNSCVIFSIVIFLLLEFGFEIFFLFLKGNSYLRIQELGYILLLFNRKIILNTFAISEFIICKIEFKVSFPIIKKNPYLVLTYAQKGA